MKPTAGQPAFSHLHVLIISDNVSDEMLLEKHLWLVEVPNNCIVIKIFLYTHTHKDCPESI